MDINQQFEHIRCGIDHRGVARITLDRTAKRNAFNRQTMQELVQAIELFADHPGVRVLMLDAEGQMFSAGADLDDMRQMGEASQEDNFQDARLLAQLMRVLDSFPTPTLVLVQGAAFGGALGLICCCDIALLGDDARFCLSEVKLGLIPAVISPYLLRTMGHRQLSRYLLTAEIIDAETALSLQLGHAVYSSDSLLSEAEDWLLKLLQNAPQAQRQGKALLRQIADHPINDTLADVTAEKLSLIRSDREAKEGLAAFFEKRPANWQLNGDKL
ncbi:enoyl-CoA hydratase-related protein [Corallincola platygyrae]|uniref:Enoyl-CoA hydratase-related protein n=2 Tax=Corallincola platygyrae TaxID=1193278 RepID=A0ABW4XIT1_9GAMM